MSAIRAGGAGSAPLNWSHIPLEVLHSELRRRQDETPKPACGTKGAKAEYNTPAHVFALILILALSTIACAFPIIARRFPNLSIPHRFLFLSRHFGTGVLIATAFVHLLPTAFVSLTDPCLPPFWNQSYPAMPGAIAMTSVLVVVGTEMFFATRGAGHVHGSEYAQLPGQQEEGGYAHDGHDHVAKHWASNGHAAEESPTPLRKLRHVPRGASAASEPPGGAAPESSWDDMPNSSRPLLDSPLPPDVDTVSSGPGSDDDSDILGDLEPDAPLPRAAPLPTASHHSLPVPSSPLPRTPSPALDTLSPAALERKLLLQCLLLEAGILFHSVFIGMSLSVSTGPPFVVLLVAISFHQTFEGLALGARIAAIPTLAPTSPKPWLMALAYGTTTPVGQAIGLSVHSLYDPKGEVGLLMVGIMNAISSGLLLFAGLVELLAEDFLSDGSYTTLRGRSRLEACAAVVAGAFLMAFVGAFA